MNAEEKLRESDEYLRGRQAGMNEAWSFLTSRSPFLGLDGIDYRDCRAEFVDLIALPIRGAPQETTPDAPTPESIQERTLRAIHAGHEGHPDTCPKCRGAPQETTPRPHMMIAPTKGRETAPAVEKCKRCSGTHSIGVRFPNGRDAEPEPCPDCVPLTALAVVHLRKGSTSDPGNFSACGAGDGVVTIYPAEVTCPSCSGKRGGQ